MAETTNKSGVYALSWRWHDESPLARHWAYYLSAEEMASAMARADADDTPVVVRSTGWVSIDDMLDSVHPAFNALAE